MIKSSYYLFPDGKMVLCNVWREGKTDIKTFKIKTDVLNELYPNLTLEESIGRYAKNRFNLFNDADFDGRFNWYRQLKWRKSI